MRSLYELELDADGVARAIEVDPLLCCKASAWLRVLQYSREHGIAGNPWRAEHSARFVQRIGWVGVWCWRRAQ